MRCSTNSNLARKPREVARVLAGLRDQLVPLVAEIAASSRRPNLEPLKRRFPHRVAGAVRPASGRRPSATTSARAESMSPTIRFARHLARAMCASPPATTRIFCRAHSSARCTRPVTACTSRACRPSDMACRPARPCRWESTNRSRGCGRTSSAAAGRFGNTSFRRRRPRLAQPLADVSARRFLFRDQRRAAIAHPHRIGRSDVQSAHPRAIRIGAGALDRRTARGRFAGCLARKVPPLPRHRAAQRCRRRAAGRALEQRGVRLLSHVLRWAISTRPAFRASEARSGRSCPPCSAAANSCRCAIGFALTSIRRAAAIRQPNWHAASPACRFRTKPCCATSAANSPRSMASNTPPIAFVG